jgi:hypothetical protein
VLNNALNNDAYVRALARNWGWTPKEAINRRLRCIGHIINLAAQAFVLSERQTEFEKALKAKHDGIELLDKQRL